MLEDMDGAGTGTQFDLFIGIWDETRPYGDVIYSFGREIVVFNNWVFGKHEQKLDICFCHILQQLFVYGEKSSQTSVIDHS